MQELPASGPVSDSIRARLSDMNPEALFADGLDDALIGVGYRCGQVALAVYDVEKAAQVLVKRDGLSYGEAMEFLEFNTIGAWVGEHTPIWMYPE